MPTLKLSVDGLHSADDEDRLQRALAAEPGIFGAIANRQDGCAEIDFEDDELALDRILQIIETSGFHGRLAG
jgi:copper chaperone CopZ